MDGGATTETAAGGRKRPYSPPYRQCCVREASACLRCRPVKASGNHHNHHTRLKWSTPVCRTMQRTSEMRSESRRANGVNSAELRPRLGLAHQPRSGPARQHAPPGPPARGSQGSAGAKAPWSSLRCGINSKVTTTREQRGQRNSLHLIISCPMAPLRQCSVAPHSLS